MELAKALVEGMLPLIEKYEVAFAGGDTNSWDGPLAISITLLGEVTGRGPLCRGGARPGDRILVTGSFGGSILGRHLDFEPRVREALALHARYELHAGIDVSDGLSLDLAHVLEESRCGAVLLADAVPVADDARRLADKLADGSTPLDHALGDGEDFELILAVPPQAAERMLAEQPLGVRLTDIGQFVAEPGLWIEDAGGRRPLAPRGWEQGGGYTPIGRWRAEWTTFIYEAADERATAALGAALRNSCPTEPPWPCAARWARARRVVQAIAEAAGVDRRDVLSPTFVLIQEYHGRR